MLKVPHPHQPYKHHVQALMLFTARSCSPRAFRSTRRRFHKLYFTSTRLTYVLFQQLSQDLRWLILLPGPVFRPVWLARATIVGGLLIIYRDVDH